MEKKPVRLYNILLPIWLLWIFPQVWLVLLPGNLLIDCAVLLLALAALRCTGKKAVLRRVWWRLWLNGFLADGAGVAVAGVCIWFLDRRALRRCPELDGRQRHITALLLAVCTAPWLFLVPMY